MFLVTEQRGGVETELRAVGCPREWRQEEGEGRWVSNRHHGVDCERGRDPEGRRAGRAGRMLSCLDLSRRRLEHPRSRRRESWGLPAASASFRE